MKYPKKKKHAIEEVMALTFTVCGCVAVAACIVITVFLVASGLPAISEIGIGEFIFGKVWRPTANDASFGIFPFILTSVYGTLGAIIAGVPIGLMCAVFISTKKGLLPSFLRTSVTLLAGIPSVVYGLVGMILVVPFVRRVFNLPDGATMFSAILVLSVMILPSVISVSETAIRSVPHEYTEGSLALGATKTETVFKVVLPSAKSGILTSVVLGIGRAVGEAMAVMMVSGNVANMPALFGSVRFLTTAVASEMSYSEGMHRRALFSVALVLFVFIIIINLILNLVIKKEKR